jgi:hypothetical protein
MNNLNNLNPQKRAILLVEDKRQDELLILRSLKKITPGQPGGSGSGRTTGG